MAARLILNRTPETPPPVPNREDDLESFWHVLFWIALEHCDHQMDPLAVVQLLGPLFDSKYIDRTGQAEGGDHKRASLTSQYRDRNKTCLQSSSHNSRQDSQSSRYPLSLR